MGVWTHVALAVSDLNKSVAFYERWAKLEVFETVAEPSGATAARLGSNDVAFVLVLIQGGDAEVRPLDGFGHLGIECESRDDVDERSSAARREGCLRTGPVDSGPPRGYWSLLVDPDGHQLELSHGQHNLPHPTRIRN